MKIIPFGLLIMLVATPFASASDRSVRPLLDLLFSVEEFDPTLPSKALVKCVLRNVTDHGFYVPVGYDGGYVVIRCPELHVELYRPKTDRKDIVLIWVEPGKEQVIFELPLDEILIPDRQPGCNWKWGMLRRPGRASPIYKDDPPGFRDRVAFAAGVRLGDGPIGSSKLFLKLKARPAAK